MFENLLVLYEELNRLKMLSIGSIIISAILLLGMLVFMVSPKNKLGYVSLGRVESKVLYGFLVAMLLFATYTTLKVPSIDRNITVEKESINKLIEKEGQILEQEDVFHIVESETVGCLGNLTQTKETSKCLKLYVVTSDADVGVIYTGMHNKELLKKHDESYQLKIKELNSKEIKQFNKEMKLSELEYYLGVNKQYFMY